MRERIFILSPAHAGGARAKLLMNPHARFELARRLQCGDASIGEVFAFVSGLYFRGKLAYARRFAYPPRGLPPALVIAAGRGLIPPETPISINELLEIAAVPLDPDTGSYREALERDAQLLKCSIQSECDVVLLGSVATDKYVAPLVRVFEDRLVFPEAFVGRGDMSRGGLMLRCASNGEELTYVPACRALRRGSRPPRLDESPHSTNGN